jgi:succinate-semialdehyde dehydrogenase/glutarate-semialdehyde dehydrogenase
MLTLSNRTLFKEACYLNGKWLQADSGQSISVNNPSDGHIIGHIPDCTAVETNRAIVAADHAFSSWSSLLAKERADILLKWSQLIDANKEDLALIMTSEQGKPLTEARGEIDYANAFIRWYAEEARRVYGDIIPAPRKDQHVLVIKQPIGVVAAITPWNFPAAMITRKIAPALAAGCTVVVKPDKATPFSALALAVLAEEAGMPAGVINMITGHPEAIGAEMTSNALVRKLSFTGSTAVGRLLMQQSAATIKKISLELGGNAPFIVFEDADVDAAVQGAMISKFRNSGQTCVCANRIYVHDVIYDQFTQQLIKAVKQLKVGNGLEKGVQQGPLINEAAVLKVQTHLEDAVSKGAKIQCGGKTHSLGGLFFEPTVLTEVNASMRIATEETFGPIAPLFRFKTEEEVIHLANATEFGLAAYFYSKEMRRIWHVSEALQYGMIGINTGIVSTEVAPFGGVKQSGIGREGSKYGMDDYVEIKYLCMSV